LHDGSAEANLAGEAVPDGVPVPGGVPDCVAAAVRVGVIDRVAVDVTVWDGVAPCDMLAEAVGAAEGVPPGVPVPLPVAVDVCDAVRVRVAACEGDCDCWEHEPAGQNPPVHMIGAELPAGQYEPAGQRV
jgi:hypothetical protein